MRTYAPALFRWLSPADAATFRAAADMDFDAAENEIVVKTITHPEYRMQLALRIMQQAIEDFRIVRTAHSRPETEGDDRIPVVDTR